ncbi:MAG: hypothetical protein ACI33M_06120 [Lysinibacillus sp.]
MMKFVTAMYIIMTMMLVVILANSTFFSGAYDGITVWLCTGLFIVGTIFFINAKQKFSNK